LVLELYAELAVGAEYRAVVTWEAFIFPKVFWYSSLRRVLK
jgi:hypothetical protein